MALTLLDGLLEDVRQADAGRPASGCRARTPMTSGFFAIWPRMCSGFGFCPRNTSSTTTASILNSGTMTAIRIEIGAELIGAEQRRRHGDAHDDVVAAEHALDQHAAALRQLFGQQRVTEREAERQQHAAHGIGRSAAGQTSRTDRSNIYYNKANMAEKYGKRSC